MTLTEYAQTISNHEKVKFLRGLSEDEFRDKIIRPLFLRSGLKDGRDCCGVNEAGKDAIFYSIDPLGLREIYVVQTKTGNINLGKKPAQNLCEVITQLTTALSTKISILETKQKILPNKAILCTSGRINDAAKDHICEEVKNSNISFIDVESIITKIDNLMPEIWCDIDVDLFPYLRALKRSIEHDTQLFTRGDLISTNLPPVTISERSFVSLNAYRLIKKRKKIRGEVKELPDFEDISVTKLLNHKEHLILLLGEAGSGKSTSLLRMVYMLCERMESGCSNFPIPVFFRAEEILKNKNKLLLDMCIERGKEIANSKNSPISTKDLNQGLLFIFIDALDEIADLEGQQTVIENSIKFISQYSNCRLIISSRPSQFIENINYIEKFARFTLSPISYKQAKKIIERLNKKNKSLPIEKTTEFLRRIQNVHGLELNPLIVTVFAASSDYSRRDIPANITELFKKFTEQMLGRWDSTKGLSLQYQAILKDFITTRIAYVMHSRKITSISVSEFKSIIANQLTARGYEADIDILTDEIVFRSGLFRVMNDRVEFRHLMLQEFFAGRGLPNDNEILELISDDWWRKALVFFFGEKPNEFELLNSITNKLDTSKPNDIYSATITIGLGLQASYLIETKYKVPLITWVISNLAKVFYDYESRVIKSSRFPLQSFLNYYLFARDSVAFGILKENYKQIYDELLTQKTKSTEDLEHFWLITGLIESGNLMEALNEVKNFHHVDPRLYLGIYLGAYFVEKHKVTTREEREIAKEISKCIDPHINELRKILFEEFKTELLEVQQNKVKCIEDSSTIEEEK